MFQTWVLFETEVVTAACRKDLHLLCLSRKAIPTSSAGEAVARCRGTEKRWETTLCFFSWVKSRKGLWMDLSSLSSPSLTHCGPNLLKHVSYSVVCPSLESQPARKCCVLWLCRRMGLPREGSIFKGNPTVVRGPWLSQRGHLSGLASPLLLREQISEQKRPWALLRWPLDP